MPCASSHHGKFVLPVSMLLVCLLGFGCGGAVTAASPGGGTTTDESSSNLASANSPAPLTTLSPGAIAFGSQMLNTAGVAQTITLTNTGAAALSISSALVSGDFAQTNNCSATLAANSSCTFTITFTPTATGARTGALTIADNASGSPQSVTLSGTGTAPGQLSASPGSIAFGGVVVDQSGNQTVIISNTGAASVTLSSASTSGPGFSISGLSLPLTLNSNQTASFTVSFGPSNDGSATGSVYLNNGAGSPTTISLSGTGINPPAHQVSLFWNPSTSQVIGYNVYRGTQSGGPYSQLNSVAESATGFSDENVSAGRTYFYVVTAVDAENVESAYSNEAAAVIPTP